MGKKKKKYVDPCTELEVLMEDAARVETMTLGEVVHRLRERGFGLLMLFLVLPNCVPIPVPPGTSTVFSLPLLFFTMQMLFGRKEPWLPRRLMEKQVKTYYLEKLAVVILPRLRKMQRFVRPRFAFASSKIGERLLGLFWLSFVASIAMPFPMTNFLPGIGILVSAFGLINRDGYVMLVGIGIGSFGLWITGSLLLLSKNFLGGFFQ